MSSELEVAVQPGRRAWTEEQRMAIERRAGDMLLDAAAGSGKMVRMLLSTPEGEGSWSASYVVYSLLSRTYSGVRSQPHAVATPSPRCKSMKRRTSRPFISAEAAASSYPAASPARTT